MNTVKTRNFDKSSIHKFFQVRNQRYKYEANPNSPKSPHIPAQPNSGENKLDLFPSQLFDTAPQTALLAGDLVAPIGASKLQ